MCTNAREANASNNTCSICGGPIDIKEYDPRVALTKRMKAEHICFHCAFWKDKILHPVKGREIINGCHYVFHKWENQGIPFQGSCGHKYYILKNNGTIKRSNNVWFQGEIPKRFRAQLPDTARFITYEAYRRIKSRYGFKCDKKGCYDRYKCFFYNREIEAKNGPWNQIPDNYQVGEECCESFLNTDTIYG